MLIKVGKKQLYLSDRRDEEAIKPEPMEVSNTALIVALGIVGFAFFLCGIMMAAL